MERVSSTLHGHSGTFILQHSGTVEDGCRKYYAMYRLIDYWRCRDVDLFGCNSSAL
jgi:hypothetical protein